MGLGSMKKLNELSQGMNRAQVSQILGEPKQTELKAGRTILKYSLHAWMGGWKPVYLVFDERGALTEWFVDENEYMRMQQLWIDAFDKFMKGGNEK